MCDNVMLEKMRQQTSLWKTRFDLGRVALVITLPI